MFRLDNLPWLAHALDGILQLPDVAGPVVLCEELHRPGGHSGSGTRVADL